MSYRAANGRAALLKRGVAMAPSSEILKRKDKLSYELSKNINEARLNARMNHFSSVTLMIVALVCSVAAGMVAFFTSHKNVAGVLAILPPLIAFIVRI